MIARQRTVRQATVLRPRALAVGCLVALSVGFASARAAEPDRAASLLHRCWPASELAAKADERIPVRGAAGAAQRIPRQSFPAAAAIPKGLQGAIRRVALPTGRKLVALTLDLCEQPGEVSGYDGAIIDHLRSQGVRATLFAGGKWLQSHAERAQQLIADPQFEMASHGWAHRNVRSLNSSDLTQEIRGPELAFQVQRAALAGRQCALAQTAAISALQPRLGLYRFPFGACSPQSLTALAENGMLAIQWDVSTGDSSKAETADAIVATLVNEVRPGSIILAHANGRGHHTAEALPRAIAKLRAKGFEFVTVSELLAAGRPEIVATCYDRRPGDTDRYDAFFAPHRARTEAADAKRKTDPGRPVSH